MELSPESIYREMEKILASRTFRSAAAQRKFLRYAVTEELGGCGHLLKEYAIGLALFLKEESFDPRVDSIVRSEARKLRLRLAKYYENEGSADPLRIHFPIGKYAPVFTKTSRTHLISCHFRYQVSLPAGSSNGDSLALKPALNEECLRGRHFASRYTMEDYGPPNPVGTTPSPCGSGLDPASALAAHNYGLALYFSHRYEEAIKQFRKALALNASHAAAHAGLGIACVHKGSYVRGIAELELAQKLTHGLGRVKADLAYAYAVSGNRDRAIEILNHFLDQFNPASFLALMIAEIYVGLGDKNRAFDWLHKGIDQKDLSVFLKSDPLYDPLRRDPRFSALLRRTNLL